jgi:hypothetical protein
MTEHSAFSARMHRALSLIRKEARQIIRDPSSIAIGIVLPVRTDPPLRLRLVIGCH